MSTPSLRIFGLAGRKTPPPLENRAPPVFLTVASAHEALRDREGLDLLRRHLPPGQDARIQTLPTLDVSDAARSDYVLSLFCDPDSLDALMDAVLDSRAGGAETVLIVAIHPRQMTRLGQWLKQRADASRLGGVRLMVALDVEDATRQLAERLRPVTEENLIRMPRSTEIDQAATQAFYVFSTELQALTARLRSFALNGIDRVLLLGGPGTGKTSLAYFYYLLRQRGRFVSINLAAENTGDKAAVKSLLCGHVSGAFPGAGARVGAFQHARDGVCFLDESHQISGAVMEVLMEALDSNQYLPYGASTKQPLGCALLFASNRSWQQLQDAVNLDEFTRLGAAVVEVPNLAQREEDLIAVIATCLARLAAPCRSWIPPEGITPDAWRRLRDTRWHGNVRSLIRVLESAFVDTAMVPGSTLIELPTIDTGLQRWEPASHHSHALYAVA